MNSIPILYQNSEIIVINKPAGTSVQGGSGVKNPLDRALASQTGHAVYLVHRLDKDTSGLMIVAKTPAAAHKWTNVLSCGRVQKEYAAVCIGVPICQNGVISAPIKYGKKTKGAVTYYKVLKVKTFKTEDVSFCLSLIHLKLGTGRMHQIRIHAALSGFPLAGDDKHGDFNMNRILKKTLGVKHLLLSSVHLTLPDGNRAMSFNVPPHEEILRIFDREFN